MLLSFSIPEMRGLIEAGLKQREATGFPSPSALTGSSLSPEGRGERVKRQTIRARGTQWLRVLAASEGGNAKGGKVTRDLHLWWKSRTRERALMGVVRGFEIYPVTIFHGCMDSLHPRQTGIVEISLPLLTHTAGVFRPEAPEGDFGAPCVDHFGAPRIAYDDGFDEWMDFVNFFVPHPGDRFVGVLIKW